MAQLEVIINMQNSICQYPLYGLLKLHLCDILSMNNLCIHYKTCIPGMVSHTSKWDFFFFFDESQTGGFVICMFEYFVL